MRNLGKKILYINPWGSSSQRHLNALQSKDSSSDVSTTNSVMDLINLFDERGYTYDLIIIGNPKMPYEKGGEPKLENGIRAARIINSIDHNTSLIVLYEPQQEQTLRQANLEATFILRNPYKVLPEYLEAVEREL